MELSHVDMWGRELRRCEETAQWLSCFTHIHTYMKIIPSSHGSLVEAVATCTPSFQEGSLGQGG